MSGRLREELRKYLALSAYLYVCFGALIVYKAAVLDVAGGHFLPHGVAAAKALILGKFLLLGEAVRVGERLVVRALWQRIVVRTLLLTLTLVVLTVLEEIVAGLIHDRAVAATLAELRTDAGEHAASTLILLLVVVPLVATSEMSRILGPGRLRALLFEVRQER